MSTDDVLATIYVWINQLPSSKAIENPATAFGSRDYAVVEYAKTALWMYIMEKSIGKDKLDKGMHAYFNDWKFKHPCPEDMQASLESATHIGLRDIFKLLLVKGNFK